MQTVQQSHLGLKSIVNLRLENPALKFALKQSMSKLQQAPPNPPEAEADALFLSASQPFTTEAHQQLACTMYSLFAFASPLNPPPPCLVTLLVLQLYMLQSHRAAHHT